MSGAEDLRETVADGPASITWCDERTIVHSDTFAAAGWRPRPNRYVTWCNGALGHEGTKTIIIIGTIVPIHSAIVERYITIRLGNHTAAAAERQRVGRFRVGLEFDRLKMFYVTILKQCLLRLKNA